MEAFKSFLLSKYSSEVPPLWVPITLPARSASEAIFTPLSEATNTIWRLFIYGSENSIFSLRFSVISRPFQRTSTRPLFSSASLEFQSIALNSTSQPKRLEASLAKSISKPTISFFSSLKPIGGKLSSRPTTIFCAASFFAVSLPQPARAATAKTSIIQTAKIFFIELYTPF